MGEERTENEVLELTDELREEFALHARLYSVDYSNREISEARDRWTPAKRRLYSVFEWDPNEPGSRQNLSEWKADQRQASMVTPAKFCEVIGGLDLLDHLDLKSYQDRMDTVDVIPFPLFKHGGEYLYLEWARCSHFPQDLHPTQPASRQYRTWGQRDVWEDFDAREEGWCKFEPPIIIPQHLRTSEDTEHSSALHYAYVIGTISSAELYTIDDVFDLDPAPFKVFLHPVDKSFWIVFDVHPSMQPLDDPPSYSYEWDSDDSDGPTIRVCDHEIWDELEPAPPVVAWRIPFSDMQRIAQRRKYIRGFVSTAIQDNDGPVPQVVVDGYDPIWNSPDVPRPLLYPPGKDCWAKYKEEILKPAALAARRGSSNVGEFQQDPGPNDPSAD
ncbi:hypothetical protein AYO20_09790 [Fonsecaea nubica]|uniref:Uncharacterized protein n=1 Tax=Fonsecaea nubica TaxID=856822 RepID=A0A178CBV4_9EURO|nr:hypothetical protein AYO20_09790 [Fonsecaea nubica]OAL27439.1 hypothetical protein AYO20_09790 [Fonsecaea nubica]